MTIRETLTGIFGDATLHVENDYLDITTKAYPSKRRSFLRIDNCNSEVVQMARLVCEKKAPGFALMDMIEESGYPMQGKGLIRKIMKAIN